MQKVVENPCAYCSTQLMESVLDGRLRNISIINEEIKKKYEINWSETLQ